MISFFEAYNWLNFDDVSHLSAPNQLSVIQIRDARIPANHQEAIIKTLRTTAYGCQNPLEKLEVLTSIALSLYERNNLTAVREILVDAVDEYPTASHRQAIVRWLLGIVLWKTMENDGAYASWRKAREHFTAICELKVKNHATESVVWYNDKINRMNLDMACTAEEAYYWLNVWEPSKLSPGAQLLASEIKKQIQKKQFPLAFEIGTRLSKVSKNRLDTTETAEAWAVLGLAVYQMGVPRLALEYWQRGSASFTPWSHQQAVTRWMMGVAQWQIPSENDQAIRNWRDAIETFSNLKTQNDHANEQKRKEWYHTHIELMEKALAQTIREKVAR